MARSADDRSRSDVLDLLRLLAPFPGRLEFTIRLALMCALTTLVTATYQTPDAALTVYLIFFMNKPDRATSTILNILMVVLISTVIGCVFLLARATVDDPLWRVASIAVISFAFLFMASASKLKPVASTVALIVAYALDLLGTTPLGQGEIITRALLYAWLFIGIPAGVSIVTNLLLAPGPRRVAQQALAERLALASAMLQDPTASMRRDFRERMYEGMTEVEKGLKLAGLERTSAPQDLAALKKASQSTTSLLLLVDMLDRENIPLSGIHRERIAATLDEMASILEKGSYPVQVLLDLAGAEPPPTPLAIATLAEIQKALTEFAEPLATPPPPPAPTHAPSGFFVPDAFTNAEHTRYALKTTAAAMFCYILYSLLNWPGIHTCFLTCYIVSLDTTAETVEKLTLRIVGCLFGAGIGIGAIVFVTPDLTSIGSLMALIFLGTLGSAWVAAGTPRISYVGFQIAFALFLCVLQGAKPGFDMVTARDRVLGVLLGNIVIYLVYTHVSPVSVGRRIDAALAGTLRRLNRMMTTANSSARRLLASDAQATLGTVSQDLSIVHYEPSAVRPSREWITSRRRVLRDIEGLMGPLFLNAECSPATATDIARRLDGFANDIDAAGGFSALPTNSDLPVRGHESSKGSSPSLRELIDTRLRDLEMTVTQSPSEQNQAVSYVPA
jgi:multidrug resistance protein MdtO